MKRKIFTLFLVFVANVGIMFAQSGTCGDNLTWNFANGVLTISGTGAMYCNAIGEYSWYSFRNQITEVVINEGVTNIGFSAFYGCSNITSVTIPASVASIEGNAFHNCTGLTQVHINNFEAWCNINFDDYYSNPIYYAKHLYVNNVEITEVVFPNTLTEIKQYTFMGWSNLITITIPNSVTNIGDNAFYGSGLTSITIPNSVTNIGDYAFYGSGLTSITIPNSVTSIGSGAFMACEVLTSLSILNPDVQYNSNGSMFQNCPQLKKIIAPTCIFDASNEDINKRQAYLAHNLDSIVVTGGQLTDNALWFITLSRKTLKSIDLSATAHTSLADETFNEFYNLTSLKLPANLTHIGYKMVAECVKLKSIDIPASVTEIDDRAFEDCRSIETITFGDVQPTSVAGIKKSSSSSQLQRIGNWAFYNAHELQHLDIPEGVTEIGDGAFYGCTYLEDLILPSSVQSIGDNCFALCGKLQKIVVNSTIPPTIEAKTFYEVKRQIPVYVPDDCVNNYKNDPLWSEFDIHGVSEMPEAIEYASANHGKAHKVLCDGQIYILMPNGQKYSIVGELIK